MSSAKWEPTSEKASWTAFEKTYTRSVMGRVDAYRREAGYTVENFCRRLDELGWPVSISTMNGMLGSKRQSLSLPELLMLARALEVSPSVLLLPLAENEVVELYPGVRLEPLDALSFIAGKWISEVVILDFLDEGESGEIAKSLDPVESLLHHRYLVDWIDTLERRLSDEKRELLDSFATTGEWADFRDPALGDGQGSEVGWVRLDAVQRSLSMLREIRRSIDARGARLPHVSRPISSALAEPKDDRRALVWAQEVQRASTS